MKNKNELNNETLKSPEVYQLKELLKRFEPITLKEMKEVELLNRAETKYIMNIDTLFEILKELPKYYKILEIKNKRKNNYQTIYYDTPTFEMYRKHHSGALNRYKIRSREYTDSNLSFMEIKFKNNKDKTEKTRIKAPHLVTELNNKNAKFVESQSHFATHNLQPSLWNKYSRITLVSKTRVERLTLDIDLIFENNNKDKTIAVPKLVIAEIKQNEFSQSSDFIKLMHKKSIRSTGFSKYCIGASMLYDNLKSNNFKEKLLLMNKVIGGIGV